MQLKKKSKKTIVIVISVSIIIFLSNIDPFFTVCKFFLDENHFRYSNGNGQFTYIEFKAHDTAMMKRIFVAFKRNSPETDTVLYRLFWKNPLAFWRWRDYYVDTRYRLPYIDWKQIIKKRGYRELKYSNTFQDF